MESRLLANDHKGGWKGCSRDFLLQRLHAELAELETELAPADPLPRAHRVGTETADVANFAMMIADVVGALR